MDLVQIKKLAYLKERLSSITSLENRLLFFETIPLVQEFLQEKGANVFKSFSDKEKYVIYALLSSDQKEIVEHFLKNPFLRKNLHSLQLVEDFYAEKGGLIGYQLDALRLMQRKKTSSNVLIKIPKKVDLSTETPSIHKKIYEAVKQIEKMAFIFPVGGAADRLHLTDPMTKEELPAAKLFFHGETLIEKLFFDLEAKEYLHYKLFGKTIFSPVFFMSSNEKNNHQHMQDLLEKKSYFYRPKNSIKVFAQPSVPVMQKTGKWCLKNPEELLLKPSGHGAIWKKMLDENIFSWLKKSSRKKALVRQINNPISRVDYGILAFIGHGLVHDMDFGFAGCSRRVGAKEGINVLLGEKTPNGYKCALSNIEYCDFARFGIEDVPESPQSPYGAYPSNTNVLFLDLERVEKAVNKKPFPGLLINAKPVKIFEGKDYVVKEAARLESTMQNISEEMDEYCPSISEQLQKSFITHNVRHKTISTTKKARKPGESFLETPEMCFYDALKNASELLTKCQVQHEPLRDFASYLEKPSPFIFRYHPSLGPMYFVIAQKIRSGKFHPHAECDLQIAELDFSDVELKGSCLIQAKALSGQLTEKGFEYSNQVGKCTLKNVKIINQGLAKESAKNQWKKLLRKESLSITLLGNGEFYAENVCFEGNHQFVVPNETKLTIYEKEGKLFAKKEAIKEPSWFWRYELEKDFSICLKKEIKKEKQLEKFAAPLFE